MSDRSRGDEHRVSATLSLAEASRRWQVAVVGAGPAGAWTAHELARRGVDVLLIDKARFPRYKVCGCCLNPRTLETLAAGGLGGLSQRLGAVPTRSVRLAAGGRHADLPLEGGVSLSRAALDAALVRAAVERGAHYLDETAVSLAPPGGPQQGAAVRRLQLRPAPPPQLEGPSAPSAAGEAAFAEAEVVVAADGLGGRLLTAGQQVEQQVSARSHVGAGVVVADEDDRWADHVIYMACAAGGYCGLVRLEDGRLDVAAALRPAAVKAAGGLGPAAADVLRGAGAPVPESLAGAGWRGVPSLTRRPTATGAERMLAVGDAAGYVEPFTGEGISWALLSASAAAPLIVEATKRWDADVVPRWSRQHARIVRRRQWVCRSLSLALRSPLLTSSLVRLLAVAPACAGPVVRRMRA